LAHGVEQCRGTLRAGHGKPAVENEKRHAFDTDGARALVFLFHRLPGLRIREALFRHGWLQARGGGDRKQVFGPGQIDAFEEVRIQESLLDPALQTVDRLSRRARECNQAMRSDRVGLARNPVERERDAVVGADRGHTRIDVLAARGAEFLYNIVLPAHALRGQLRIELERPPDEAGPVRLGVLLGVQIERRLDLPLADVAPGADHVRNDVDVHVFSLRLRAILSLGIEGELALQTYSPTLLHYSTGLLA
jgi:hypothetical protein